MTILVRIQIRLQSTGTNSNKWIRPNDGSAFTGRVVFVDTVNIFLVITNVALCLSEWGKDSIRFVCACVCVCVHKVEKLRHTTAYEIPMASHQFSLLPLGGTTYSTYA